MVDNDYQQHLTTQELLKVFRVRYADIREVMTEHSDITVEKDNATVLLIHPDAGTLEIPEEGSFEPSQEQVEWFLSVFTEKERYRLFNVGRFNWQMINTRAVEAYFSDRAFSTKHEMVEQLHGEVPAEDLAEMRIDPRIKIMDLDTFYQRLSTVNLLGKMQVRTRRGAGSNLSAVNYTQFWLEHQDEDAVLHFVDRLFQERPDIKREAVNAALQDMSFEEMAKLPAIRQFVGELSLKKVFSD